MLLVEITSHVLRHIQTVEEIASHAEARSDSCGDRISCTDALYDVLLTYSYEAVLQNALQNAPEGSCVRVNGHIRAPIYVHLYMCTSVGAGGDEGVGGGERRAARF